jgi:hypothetical protein
MLVLAVLTVNHLMYSSSVGNSIQASAKNLHATVTDKHTHSAEQCPAQE